jgi:hypothetical protein
LIGRIKKGIKVYKDELIYLHQLFEFIMKLMVSNGVSKDSFKRYSRTGMSSNHLYKTKEEHEYALMMLSSELSGVLAEIYEDIPPTVPKRFEWFAKKAKKRQKA